MASNFSYDSLTRSFLITYLLIKLKQKIDLSLEKNIFKLSVLSRHKHNFISFYKILQKNKLLCVIISCCFIHFELVLKKLKVLMLKEKKKKREVKKIDFSSSFFLDSFFELVTFYNYYHWLITSILIHRRTYLHETSKDLI